MAKKKVIIKLTPEEEEEEAKKKAARRVERAERVKGKKSKKKRTAAAAAVEKPQEKPKEEKEEAAEEVELEEGIDVFEEEGPSGVEREIEAAEEGIKEELVLDRVFVVPLAKEFMKAPRWKRTKRAVKALRDFVERHAKPTVIYIDPSVNERLWERGIKHPPRKIRIRVTKNTEGLVRVMLE